MPAFAVRGSRRWRRRAGIGWGGYVIASTTARYRVTGGVRRGHSTPAPTAKPQYLGECELSSRRPYRCHLYLYKKTEQYRRVKRSSYHQAKHADNEVFARQQREPWLLATNLDPVHFKALRIVRLYGKRMGIEAGFRDLKSDEFGFGLSLSRSRRLDRLNMLLLIAALATVCLWWVGLIAEQSNWHRQFQANTVRDRRVLSVPYLGREVVRRGDYLITLGDLILAPQLLLQHISTAHEL